MPTRRGFCRRVLAAAAVALAAACVAEASLVSFRPPATQADRPAQVAPSAPPPAPSVRYSREFKGSQPPFLSVTISQSGQAEYEVRESETAAPMTLTFTASPAVVARIFSLAGALDDFSTPIDDKGAKVGFMGTKTLTYEAEGRHIERQFNYTTLRPAVELSQLFEAIAATGEDALALRRAMQFDELGVVDTLNRITLDWKSKNLAEPQLLLPVLQQACDDPNLMALAQRRARQLIAEMTKR